MYLKSPENPTGIFALDTILDVIKELRPNPKAVIHWRDRKTGKTGNGQPIDLATAKAHLLDLNKRYPDVEHWLVPHSESND